MSVSQLVSPACEPFATPRVPAHVDSGYFAFANIRGNVNLVQVSSATPASALTTVDVKIFRHEFINIFRFTEARTLHPADISILESIDDSMKHYEEDKETVYLAKELVGRVRNLTDPRFSMMQHGGFHMARVPRRQR
ncbi:hypothetical protein D9756_008252 [Leucocoprinus leucothites]|uniref:Uncharacterized protein n=1 Tax=Leucocoprinus leucothites TaxID=201217 RepID=A0A8H5CZR2_9AGAR|nr:hypothetical protein D9756_008252 [Leucoagaricus leucothites]